jgi:hypothetical protein
MERTAVLGLYRQLLRAVQYYPSVRRGAVYEAVREEFRLNRGLRPEDSVEKLRLALCELERLSIWRPTRDSKDLSRPNSASDWTIQL